MSELTGKAGEVHMTVQVRRAATGKVEEYQLVGKVTHEQQDQLIKEHQNGCNTLDGSTERSD